jgi:hypothetical protein
VQAHLGISFIISSLKNKELENKLPTKNELIRSRESYRAQENSPKLPRKNRITPGLNTTSPNIFRFKKLDKNEKIVMKKLLKRRKIIEKFKSKSQTQTKHVKKKKN